MTEKTGTTRRTGIAALLAIAALIAVFVAVLLITQSGAVSQSILGLAQRDEFTAYGVTVTAVLAEVAAVVVVGSLLLAAFLVPPKDNGRISADGYAALRTAGLGAWAWFVTSLLAATFVAADTAGRPVGDLLDPRTFASLVGVTDQPRAWLITAAVALALVVACRVVLSWGWSVVLFGVALVGLVPVGLTGHSSAGGSHDLATDSLLIHLVGAALWVGGLVAVLALARRGSEHTGLAVRRFSALALWCWIAMALSGVVNALVRMSVADLFTTSYGLLVFGKIVLLLVLGVFGHQHRTRSLPAASGGDRRTFLQLAGVEVLIMFATLGVAGALVGSVPPADASGTPSKTELLIGYDLDGPPTVLRLLFDWRFDLIYGTAAIAMAALYIAGVVRLRRRGDAWPLGRTVAWLAGCLTILIATSSGIGRYAPAMFSVHMGLHMMLSMLAPVLLVLGGSVTLALRALPAAGSGRPPGPREWILAFVRSPISRFLTHPVVALVLFVGSFYALYFSGLFATALNYHWAHLLMNAHFLLTGYVFYWPLIGVDPAPRRLPPIAKLGVMFASMPFHAFFGVIMMGSQTPLGGSFYSSLGLPWMTDLLGDQKVGGGIAWAFGEVPALLVAVALMVQWAQADDRAAVRRDRRTRAHGDEELDAYNAMLAQLAGRSDSSSDR